MLDANHPQLALMAEVDAKHKKSYILKLFIIDIIPHSNLAVQIQYCGLLAGLFTFHSTCCVQKKKKEKKGIRPLGISTCIGPSSRWPIAA